MWFGKKNRFLHPRFNACIVSVSDILRCIIIYQQLLSRCGNNKIEPRAVRLGIRVNSSVIYEAHFKGAVWFKWGGGMFAVTRPTVMSTAVQIQIVLLNIKQGSQMGVDRCPTSIRHQCGSSTFTWREIVWVKAQLCNCLLTPLEQDGPSWVNKTNPHNCDDIVTFSWQRLSRPEVANVYLPSK